MKLKKYIILFLISCYFSSTIQALFPTYKTSPELNYLFFKETPQPCWLDYQTNQNQWHNSSESIIQNCAFEASINCNETTFIIFANTKMITLSINTKLLLTVTILAIAYKFNYFNKIKKYFIGCDDDAEQDNNEKEQNS